MIPPFALNEPAVMEPDVESVALKIEFALTDPPLEIDPDTDKLEPLIPPILLSEPALRLPLNKAVTSDVREPFWIDAVPSVNTAPVTDDDTDNDNPLTAPTALMLAPLVMPPLVNNEAPTTGPEADTELPPIAPAAEIEAHDVMPPLVDRVAA